MLTATGLAKQLDEMIKATTRGNLDWRMTIESTDDLQPELKEKFTADDGIEYLVDECFVEYTCKYNHKDFTMISYEHVLTHEDTTRMTCLIFLPPQGMRFFDVNQLAPYAVKADAIVSNKVHVLWETLMALYKETPSRIELRVIDPLK